MFCPFYTGQHTWNDLLSIPQMTVSPRPPPPTVVHQEKVIGSNFARRKGADEFVTQAMPFRTDMREMQQQKKIHEPSSVTYLQFSFFLIHLPV